MKDFEQFFIQLAEYSILFFKDRLFIDNLDRYLKNLKRTGYDDVKILDSLVEIDDERLKQAVELSSSKLNENKKFLVSCIKYFLIIRYDYFYLIGNYYFTSNYLNDYPRTNLAFLWDIEDEDSDGKKIKSLLVKLNKALNRLSKFQDDGFTFSRDEKVYEIDDLVVLKNEWFPVVFKDVRYEVDKTIIINDKREFLKMYLNVIHYVESKVFVINSTVLISINNFIRKSSPCNFVYLLYFILDTYSRRSFQTKKLLEVEKYVRSIIKNDLFYFGFLEHLDSVDFSSIKKLEGSKQVLLF